MTKIKLIDRKTMSKHEIEEQPLKGHSFLIIGRSIRTS